MAFNGVAWTVAASVALATLAPAQSHAQAKYPDRPVKVVIGFTAGGGTDVAGRVIAQKLSEATGQSFVVENRPGASGLIASEQVAKSPADGYDHHGRQPDHARGRARALQKIPARRDQGAHRPRHDRHLAAGCGGQRQFADPLDQGPDRRGQGEERRDELRLRRRRHHAAHGGRAVRVQRRHQDGPRRLSRRGARHQRPARRADSVHVLQPVGGEGQHRRRQAAGARRDQLQARAVAAGRADRRRNLPGLRRRDLVRAGRVRPACRATR